MAHFDTDHILNVITHETLADHETNRVVLETFLSACDREITHVDLVREVLAAVLRQAAQSSHGRDMVVALVNRFTDEARAQSLARIELAAQGCCPDEIEFTLQRFPEDFTPEVMLDRPLNRNRGPTHQELMEAGAI
jgi:uncharacterized protein YdaU (DUF1376 family)